MPQFPFLCSRGEGNYEKSQALQCKGPGIYVIKQNAPILRLILENQNSDRNGTRTDGIDGSPEIPDSVTPTHVSTSETYGTPSNELEAKETI